MTNELFHSWFAVNRLFILSVGCCRFSFFFTLILCASDPDTFHTSRLLAIMHGVKKSRLCDDKFGIPWWQSLFLQMIIYKPKPKCNWLRFFFHSWNPRNSDIICIFLQLKSTRIMCTIGLNSFTSTHTHTHSNSNGKSDLTTE